MSSPSPRPTGVVVDLEKRLLQITWSDAHVSLYDFRTLRDTCPCAECKPWAHGGPVGELPESVLTAPAEIRSVSDVGPVGGYALNIRWSDGHAYGIYSWEYLLEICPCDEHQGFKNEWAHGKKRQR